jgi:hypothetical protein
MSLANDNDFYGEAVGHRMNQLETALAQCRANMVAAKAAYDYDAGAENAQYISNLEAEIANLTNAWNRHVASQTPRMPRQRTPEEWAVARPEDLNPQERLEMAAKLAQTSKFGVDPAGFWAGVAEANKRSDGMLVPFCAPSLDHSTPCRAPSLPVICFAWIVISDGTMNGARDHSADPQVLESPEVMMPRSRQ